jgi:hypothetical protein
LFGLVNLAHTVIYRSGKYKTMPRLSLYKPEKGNDYRFIDKNVWEMFQVGGTDVLFHKYTGPGGTSTPDQATPTTPFYENPVETQIQDLLFLENRDRKYDPDVYVLRGVYNIQDIDFNLSQFGLFLQNDTIFITFHINDTVEKLGRKIISGDVIELPHLKDEYALNDFKYSLKRFYVVEDVNRASEGFSATWYPHLYRAKCKPLVDSQEFKDILDGIADSEGFVGAYNSEVTYYPGDVITGMDGKKYNVIKEVTGVAPPNTEYYEIAETLRDIMSTYELEMQITQAVLNQAELDSPMSGPDTSNLWSIQRKEDGTAELVSVDRTDIDASVQTQATDQDGNLLFDANNNPIYVGATASTVLQTVDGHGYNGIIYDGDGIPPNGAPFTAGIAFPMGAVEGQFCLRKDYYPYRLFRFNGNRWVKVEDKVRMTLNNLGASDVGQGDRFEGKEVRQTLRTSFVNNENQTTIKGKVVKEKQSISKALRPEADE